MPPEELERLVKETRQLAEDNNRLLRRIRRDAVLGFVARIVIWLVVLGVPLFFLGSYLAPIMDAVSGSGSESFMPGPFGLPSEDQVNKLIEQYQAQYQ
ncbi:hypothetical protein KJ819_03005 [Patescibacteria group bacterium]|nr:hypothetical protein [Patescibacteria group bacterium]MBU1500758.1 hypothetical protein [Patescibacteria group bacterium]MBU2080813.1 hypothetical protein [Patescibacteria group bacterium]MBU2123918.1 hypothetical protein [Patescibacteria group bacterium]MBU2194791.1 hypothetical protein [Patescibacteria group bacterium]